MSSRALLSARHRSLRAPEQLWFSEIIASDQIDRLFLAIRPDLAAAVSIDRLARQLRARHELHSQPLAIDRFHVSLHGLGDYIGLRRDLIEIAGVAAATMAIPPFTITFDRVLSFSGGELGCPLVLRSGENGLNTLKEFQHHLGVALMKAGWRHRISKQFEPHVTLLYDHQSIPEQRVEPISWVVNEFVLIHSLVRQTQHIIRARWPLQGSETIGSRPSSARPSW